MSLSTLTIIHTDHIPVGVEIQVTDELTSRLQRPMMRNPIQGLFSPGAIVVRLSVGAAVLLEEISEDLIGNLGFLGTV